MRSARLVLVEAQAFHARAIEGDMQHDMRRAYEAAQEAIKKLNNQLEADKFSFDKALFAQAQLLKANTLANLASIVETDMPDALGTAYSAVGKAACALWELKDPDVGNALRVMGVIQHKLRNDPRSAEEYFLAAIRFFQEYEHINNKWYAVSHWNLYRMLIDCNSRKAVSFLQRAGDLREEVEGAEHPYTRMYRQQLEKERRSVPDLHDDVMHQEVSDTLQQFDRILARVLSQFWTAALVLD